MFIIECHIFRRLTATFYKTVSTYLCLWLDVSSTRFYTFVFAEIRQECFSLFSSITCSFYRSSQHYFFQFILRNTYPRNVICLRIMSCLSPFLTPALRNTSHVLTLLVQGILNILLKNQCSDASKVFIIPLLNVHVSHPYSIVDQIQHFNTLSRTGILMFLPHNTFFIDVNAVLAIPIRFFGLLSRIYRHR